MMTNPKIIISVENSTLIIELIEKFPDNDWDWDAISYNPNLTLEWLDKYPNKPWNWDGLSANPNLTFDILKMQPQSF